MNPLRFFLSPPRAPGPMRLVLVATALVFAGCVSPAAVLDEPPAALAPLSLPIGLRGCQAVVVLVGVPHGALAPHLPDGFRSLSAQEVVNPLAPNPRDEGNLGLEMFVCEEADGLNGTISPAVYGSVFSAVETPEEYRRDVGFHFVKWDVVVSDPALRATLRERGVPAWDATATFDDFTSVGNAFTLEGALAFESGVTLEFEGRAAAPYTPQVSFVEYTEVPRGLAAWQVTSNWAQIAVGAFTVRAVGEGIANEILGDAPREGAGFAGVVDFDDASVELP